MSEMHTPDNYDNWPSMWKSCYRDGITVGMDARAKIESQLAEVTAQRDKLMALLERANGFVQVAGAFGLAENIDKTIDAIKEGQK